MKFPRIKLLSRNLALEVLRAYNREISFGYPDERERGQAKAFEVAEKHIRNLVPAPSLAPDDWLEDIVDE